MEMSGAGQQEFQKARLSDGEGPKIRITVVGSVKPYRE
jgi:hypothetical protein